MPPHFTAEAMIVCVVMFTVASLTGLANLLQSKRTITLRAVVGGMLARGLLGLAAGAVWLAWYPDKPFWLPLGVSILVGLSPGVNAKDIFNILLRALNLQVKRDDEDGVDDRTRDD